MKKMKIMNRILKVMMWDNGPKVMNKSMFTIDRRLLNTGTKATKVALKNEWNRIDWKKAEMKVKDLQEKIVIATLNSDMREVYNLQWKLINCFEAKAIAIRRIVTNKGGKTAGTDNIVWKSSQNYWSTIEQLTTIVKNPNGYRAQPLRIPKGKSSELRPIGIPTLIDRAVQALYHLGVDPVVETKSDPNSYGFRKYRSRQDAITAIRSILDKKNHPRWILEADISKCFDRISDDFLMKHTPICHKVILEQWLKSGVMENMNYIETIEGTPQGGIISPTLCNITLNGMENLIKEANPLKRGISPGVHIIRYGDDMIITGKNQEILIKNKEILKKFLEERGLQLNENKTQITNIKSGFDFLGFNIRRMDWNPRLNKNTDQKTVLIIKPSKKGIRKLMDTINNIIVMNKPIIKIISEINPVLRRWGEDKRISYHTQETFITIDNWIYRKMLKWAYWHKGSLRRNVLKYKIKSNTRSWNWGVSQTQKIINLGPCSA